MNFTLRERHSRQPGACPDGFRELLPLFGKKRLSRPQRSISV
jgi:hypothetical protein